MFNFNKECWWFKFFKCISSSSRSSSRRKGNIFPRLRPRFECWWFKLFKCRSSSSRSSSRSKGNIFPRLRPKLCRLGSWVSGSKSWCDDTKNYKVSERVNIQVLHLLFLGEGNRLGISTPFHLDTFIIQG